MKDHELSNKTSLSSDLILHKLTLGQIKRIDEMLVEVGEYGEVRIIVQKGELRYINKVESYKLWEKENKD